MADDNDGVLPVRRTQQRAQDEGWFEPELNGSVSPLLGASMATVQRKSTPKNETTSSRPGGYVDLKSFKDSYLDYIHANQSFVPGYVGLRTAIKNAKTANDVVSAVNQWKSQTNSATPSEGTKTIIKTTDAYTKAYGLPSSAVNQPAVAGNRLTPEATDKLRVETSVSGSARYKNVGDGLQAGVSFSRKPVLDEKNTTDTEKVQSIRKEQMAKAAATWATMDDSQKNFVVQTVKAQQDITTAAAAPNGRIGESARNGTTPAPTAGSVWRSINGVPEDSPKTKAAKTAWSGMTDEQRKYVASQSAKAEVEKVRAKKKAAAASAWAGMTKQQRDYVVAVSKQQAETIKKASTNRSGGMGESARNGASALPTIPPRPSVTSRPSVGRTASAI